jgi:hypothetical protein
MINMKKKPGIFGAAVMGLPADEKGIFPESSPDL